MVSRGIALAFLIIQTIIPSKCDKNVTQDSKSKRGLINLSDGGSYSVLPLQHLATYTQVQSLAPSNSPLVDITYKPSDVGYLSDSQIFNIAEQNKGLQHDNIGNAQIIHPQHTYQPHQLIRQNQHQTISHITPSYASNPVNHQHNLNFQIKQQPIHLPSQQILATNYPALYPTIKPHSIYAPVKSLHFPSESIKIPQKQIQSSRYTSVPINYDSLQGSFPPVKFVPPSPNSQIKLSHDSIPTFSQYPIQNLNIHQNRPAKLQNSPHLHPHRPYQVQNSQFSSSPIYQISQNFQAIDPNFIGSQQSETPNPHQLHQFEFSPERQDPFQSFTKPIQPTPSIPKSIPPQNKHNDYDDNDEEDDDDSNQGNEEKHPKSKSKLNEEEEFYKGYRDASRGFPTIDDDDDDNDNNHKNSRYTLRDDSPKRGNYKSTRYTSVIDHDSNDHDDHYREHDHSSRPGDYDEYRRGRHYHDDDHEGHYSHHTQKQEKQKKPQQKDSIKQSEKNSNGRQNSKPHKYSHSERSQHSSSSRKPNSDSRYAADSSKIHKTIQRHPKHSSNTKSESKLTEPTFQYGFEPIRNPHPQSKSHTEDSEGRHSSQHPVVTKKKIYKENWYISQTNEE